VYIGSNGIRITEAKKLLEFLNNEMLKDGKKQIRWTPAWESSRFLRQERNGWSGAPSSMRWRTSEERYAGAQRQHSEIYGGRLPRLGLRSGAGGIRAQTITERESWIVDIWTRIRR